ncbi:MAG: catechol 1,2-dioxygenase [Myxococcota bacterium]
MGEIVAAAVLSHQPAIMAPEAIRAGMGGGQDTTLVAGFETVREALDRVEADTFVIFDTHFFTTLGHVVAGGDRYHGLYTSDELPMVLNDHPFDFPGAPELAGLTAEVAAEKNVPVFNTPSPNIAMQYPTVNIVHYIGRGEKVMRVGICQQAERHNFLDFGAVLAEAIQQSDSRVALIGSGGMSHQFPKLDDSSKHAAFDASCVLSDEAREKDRHVLDLWERGDHAAVLDYYPEYQAVKPEGRFGHYLMMAGALGGRDWTAKGRRMSEYENALATGQVHVWFDLEAR